MDVKDCILHVAIFVEIGSLVALNEDGDVEDGVPGITVEIEVCTSLCRFLYKVHEPFIGNNIDEIAGHNFKVRGYAELEVVNMEDEVLDFVIAIEVGVTTNSWEWRTESRTSESLLRS